MIIAFSGAKFVGKDTTAEGLIARHGFKRIALADKLKDICSTTFGVPRKDMDDPSKKEVPFESVVTINADHVKHLLGIIREDGFIFDFAEKCDLVCKDFVGVSLTSIRNMLQVVGTDMCRVHIQDDIWLGYIKKMIDVDHNYVITDARFKNERAYLKQIGATLILVKRPGYAPSNSHISENELGEDADYDVVINNDNNITSVQSGISMWYTLVKKDK